MAVQQHWCQAYLELDVMTVLRLRLLALVGIWVVMLALTGQDEEGEGGI